MYKKIILVGLVVGLVVWAIAQALYRIPMKKIRPALENPIIQHHSEYTVIDLLDELDAQGYNTKPIREEFFSTNQPPTKPQTSYPGTEGYEKDYIKPDTGTAGTTSTFRIKYQDEGGFKGCIKE